MSNKQPRHLLDHPTRMEILRFLEQSGESYNAEIAKNLVKPSGEIGFDESTVIRDLRKLKLNGYINEVAHPETDKKKYYKITQKGRDAIKGKK